jgi:EAL domain-containing protein (putative c-di-GMP-specific phosphodiesterase class I)
MGTDEDSPIANVIAKLANELGIGLIAEGVETRGQAEHLMRLDCPHAQGEYYSMAMPANEVEDMLWRVYAQVLAAAS